MRTEDWQVLQLSKELTLGGFAACSEEGEAEEAPSQNAEATVEAAAAAEEGATAATLA